MKMIILHDHINPDQEVLLDIDSISSVVPFGSGSVINGSIGVHENPSEVEQVIENASNS